MKNQTEQRAISKAQARGKKKVFVCHHCNHVSRLGDSGNIGKGSEKRLLSSQAALNEVSELGSCQVKE